MDKALLENYKKTIIFLGYLKNDEKGNQIETFIWTAFLVQISNVFCLVTAKHVVFNLDQKWKAVSEKKWILAFNNILGWEKGVKYVSIDQYKNQWLTRFTHTKNQVDIAIMPFPINLSEDDIKTIPESEFLWLDNIWETDDVFFMSYQPWVNNLWRDWSVMPIVRKWSIARKNNDKSFLIDGSVFPWNSWSPVFMMPSAVRMNGGWINIWPDPFWWKLIWVISSYIPYQDVAISNQTKRPRVIFEENTWLSNIQSINLLNEIIWQKDFQEKLQTLQQKKK